MTNDTTPLDRLPHHPNGNKKCPCGRDVFYLYNGKCEGCAGLPIHSGPIEWQDITAGGRFRLRRTPLVGDGIPSVYEYEPPKDYTFPEVISEDDIDAESTVRTVALENPNKYGKCYESVFINKAKGIKRNIFYYRNKTEAAFGHAGALEYAAEMRKRKSTK